MSGSEINLCVFLCILSFFAKVFRTFIVKILKFRLTKKPIALL